DVAQRDLLRVAPGGEVLRGELGAVIEAQGLGPAVERDELLEDADDAGRRDRCPHFDGQRSPVGLIEQVGAPEAPPAVERVMHEVEGQTPFSAAGATRGWRSRCGTR